MTIHTLSHEAHDAAVQAELQALRTENARLKANLRSNIKVSTKGAVSVYGFGRWPVTLYKSQWVKLFAMIPEIQGFIKANEALLSVKDEE